MSTSNTRRSRLIGLAITTALASTSLTGCAVFKPDDPKLSADAPTERSVAQPSKQASKAIDRSEHAVLASPRDVNARIALGATYLEAGRFHSAEQSFADAMELGADSADVVVSRALALIANGNMKAAHNLLTDHQDNIDPADLGLAFALAGDTHQGSRILAAALRDGQNNAKVRQNFAYTLALAGEWRGARLMVAEDVPADQVGKRIAAWAATAHQGAHQQRIATLLNVSPSADSGRPQALALVNHPDIPALAAEASEFGPLAPQVADEPVSLLASMEPMDVPVVEPVALAAVEAPSPAPVVPVAPAKEKTGPVRIALAPSNAAPAQPEPVAAVAGDQPKVVAKPAAAKKAPVRVAKASLESGNHMVQLGSFLSKDQAQRAWDVYVSRYPELDGVKMALTEAEIDGTRYYRVAAADLAETSAASLCSSVKRSGHGCFAYAKATKLPGTVGRAVRMART